MAILIPIGVGIGASILISTSIATVNQKSNNRDSDLSNYATKLTPQNATKFHIVFTNSFKSPCFKILVMDSKDQEILSINKDIELKTPSETFLKLINSKSGHLVSKIRINKIWKKRCHITILEDITIKENDDKTVSRMSQLQKHSKRISPEGITIYNSPIPVMPPSASSLTSARTNDDSFFSPQSIPLIELGLDTGDLTLDYKSWRFTRFRLSSQKPGTTPRLVRRNHHTLEPASPWLVPPKYQWCTESGYLERVSWPNQGYETLKERIALYKKVDGTHFESLMDSKESNFIMTLSTLIVHLLVNKHK